MNKEQILDKLNDWDESGRVNIPEEIECKKELNFIKRWREDSNDGFLCGPTDVETAKMAIELISQGYSIDFGISGGITDINFFTYAYARDAVTFIKTHEYYNEVRKFLNEHKSSEKELFKILMNGESDPYELDRDLKTFVFTEKSKKKIIEIVAK